jgi:catechol 2,3-dioxygenase-like lactoylglutathione lyase family enzyme
MRGMIDHLDLTVRDPWASRPFYQAVLGHMGYTRIREDARGFDFDIPDGARWAMGIGVMQAVGEGLGRRHDRYSPGLHHVAFAARDRADVDALHRLLVSIGATILDAPAEYPQYGEGYYALFFADPDGLKLEFVHRP